VRVPIWQDVGHGLAILPATNENSATRVALLDRSIQIAIE
jgi:hypothetical protein